MDAAKLEAQVLRYQLELQRLKSRRRTVAARLARETESRIQQQVEAKVREIVIKNNYIRRIDCEAEFTRMQNWVRELFLEKERLTNVLKNAGIEF